MLILAAERQERERQIGADTSKGYFMSDATDIDQYNGDRSFQMVVRTGEDVQSRQALRDAEPLGFVINDGKIYINLLGMWVCGYSVNANTTYHVVATFNKATMRAKLYVAGAFVSESKPRETEATYSSYFSIGNNRSANKPVYPFQGAIMLNRDFDYELTAEEVMSLDNNGDPAGYVLSASMKQTTNSYVNLQSPMTSGGWLQYQLSVPFEIVNGAIAVTYPVEANKGYQNGLYHRLDKVIPRSYRFILRFKAKADVDRSLIRVFVGGGIAELHFSQEVTLSTEFTEYVLFANKTWNPGFPDNMHFVGFYPIYNKPATGKYYIKDVSVIPIGCIAEYMPQNIIISRKRDFPQVTLPISGYTQSSGVFLINSLSSTTESMNLPQANGFSGKYMRFDAVTMISLYCAYWYYYLEKRLPIKITFEYRANRTIYASQQSTAPTAPDAVAIDANEGDAQIASVIYGIGGFAYMFSAADTEAWLEMRVLAIEVVEDVCLGWLDSAKQLPLNNEYLRPLLESINGYDLTAIGTPEIDYKPTMIVDWSMLVPMSLDGLAVYPGGTVPPAIVDGVLRITSNEKQGSYGGGGRYLNVVNATPGDTVEWDFEIRALGITEAMTCLSVGGSLYYIKVTSTTPEWQRCSYVTPVTTNSATDFWISKAYNDTTAGYIEIRNITIKTYRK